MKIKVQTKSGEFSFDSEPGETLLYAGLRHGLTLPYECATGTCGTCRARVGDGEIEHEWDAAPGLSYVKQEKNELLMCRATARGDCTLRVPAQVSNGGDGDALPAYCGGVIERFKALTHDVVRFEVAIDRPMRFEAGQFVVLETPHVVGTRAYSMVNYDAEAKALVFIVKRKPGGKFSDWLFDTDVAGQALKLYGPLGKATFAPEEGKNILCLGGGSGIAGMVSIIDRGCSEGYFRDHKGYVFFGVRSANDTFLMDELSAFVEAFPEALEVTVALSDEDPSAVLQQRYPRLKLASGFVHSVASERMAGKYDNITAYVAGPPPMVDGALRMLVLEARLAGSDIKYDKFG